MGKKLTIFLVLMIVPSITFAYKVGDRIDESVVAKIGDSSKKIILVDFFASWCSSCEKELPLISKLNNENIENINIVGIDTDDDKVAGLAFQKKLKLNFKIINDDKHLLVNKFSPYGIPALYYIKDNKVKKIIFGAIDDIDKVIKKDIEDM